MVDKELIHDLLVEEIAVIPVKKNKAPALPKGHNYLYELIDIDKIDKYFSNCYGIGVPGGQVSGGIECLDFDDHKGDKDIESKFREYCRNPFVKSLIESRKVYVQKTPSGGFHLIYRYNADFYEGGSDLALWPDKEVMIETRGNGQYFIINPTPGYQSLYNDFFGLTSIEKDDRNILIDLAKNFNQYNSPEEGFEIKSTKNYNPIDPISYYNKKCGKHARNVLRDAGWKCEKPQEKIQNWTRPGKNSGNSATFDFKEGEFYVFTSNGFPFEAGVFYTPFEILAYLQFKKDWKAAYNWILEKYLGEKIPYLRIAADYYKKIKYRDRFGIARQEIKVWKKDEIKTDHGKDIFDKIPKFDKFIMQPDNKNYKPIIDNCYNLYKPFPHRPADEPGEWKWTKILLEHIFGDQYEIGIRYVQSLYQHPKKALPILALVSKERSTGKTTFLNWLNMIFGENMVVIAPEDITGSFNSSYAFSNIIAVEETIIDKKHTIEKVKALSTGKFINVNRKFIDNYKLDFYGHIIMTSNDKKRFINIDEEEIRFFIRELSKPQFKNFSIEDDVIKEIPYFLNYLDSRTKLDYSKSRALFTPEEISNENLIEVKEESKSWLYEELLGEIENFFNENEHVEGFYASYKDIKTKFFANNNKVDLRYLRKVLVDEMNLLQEKMTRYDPFIDINAMQNSKPGTPFLFLREKFTEEKNSEKLPF